MTEQTLRRFIPWLAAIFIGAASEFYPIVGMFAAALVFPEGIHSGHGTAYLVLAIVLNFAIISAATFLIFKFITRRFVTTKTD